MRPAAHCMKQNGEILSVTDVLIILGRYNIKEWENDDLESVQRRPSEIVVHPDYKKASADADISIIVLEKEVRFTKFIKPICLWNENTNLNLVVSESGVVAGWGKDEKGVIVSPVPKQVTLPIVSQEDCIRSHETFHDITSTRTFCAGECSHIAS